MNLNDYSFGELAELEMEIREKRKSLIPEIQEENRKAVIGILHDSVKRGYVPKVRFLSVHNDNTEVGTLVGFSDKRFTVETVDGGIRKNKQFHKFLSQD